MMNSVIRNTGLNNERRILIQWEIILEARRCECWSMQWRLKLLLTFPVPVLIGTAMADAMVTEMSSAGDGKWICNRPQLNGKIEVWNGNRPARSLR